MIEIKRIGVVLPDGVIKGLLLEKIVFSQTQESILNYIRKGRMVKHTKLLNRFQRHVDKEKLNRIIETLRDMGEVIVYRAEKRGGGNPTFGDTGAGAKYYASREEHEMRLMKEGNSFEHIAGGTINRVPREIEKRQASREKEMSFMLSDEQVSAQKMEPINFDYNYWAYRDTVVHVSTDYYYYPENEIILEIKSHVLSIEKKVMALESEVSSLEGLEQDEGKKRERIPEKVRMDAWRRDEGRCVECGSKERLEFDHLIPVSKGGSNTLRNIQLLCENCNRRKSDSI